MSPHCQPCDSGVWMRRERGEGVQFPSRSYQCNCIECAYFYDHSVGIVKFPVAHFDGEDWVTGVAFDGATKQATLIK